MSIIREKREAKKWSRKELAEKLGVHEQVVVRFENGQAPTILQVARIYQILKISFKDLKADYNKDKVVK